MKTLSFKKESDGRWYVDLPEWTGDHADLEMVAGADVLLNYLTLDDETVRLAVSEVPFSRADKLILVREALELENGAIYKVSTLSGVPMENMEVWLCDVTKFVLGRFPVVIYFEQQLY